MRQVATSQTWRSWRACRNRWQDQQDGLDEQDRLGKRRLLDTPLTGRHSESPHVPNRGQIPLRCQRFRPPPGWSRRSCPTSTATRTSRFRGKGQECAPDADRQAKAPRGPVSVLKHPFLPMKMLRTTRSVNSHRATPAKAYARATLTRSTTRARAHTRQTLASCSTT